MVDKNYSYLDIYFSRFLCERSGFDKREREQFTQIVRELTASLRGGHSCLPLSEKEITFISRADCVSTGDKTPLVLWNDKLYLQKYFRYEGLLANSLAALSLVNSPLPYSEILEQCFAGNCEENETDWQKKAAETALQYDLCIISGGPGTGKTSTVVRILALLLLNLGEDCEIALAAPTGKAAMRLRTSISKSLPHLAFPQKVKEKIPQEAMTIHRLLGVVKDSVFFRHNSDNPLAYDVVVVDEASMVDLALMSKLVSGLKSGGKLLLLGDKDQLASVESGSVLGDVIEGLPDNTVHLKKSYRFDSGIKKLAQAINNGECEKVWQLLSGNEYENVGLQKGEVAPYATSRYEEFARILMISEQLDLPAIFSAFNRFQVLCGVRRGKRGVEGLNLLIEDYFCRQGLGFHSGKWYHGRPVLITKNDYSLGLYNGDIGICLKDPEDQTLKVWFEQSDCTFSKFLPFRLPQCETAFAMTIHKSQGSEFEEVLVVLPEEDNQVLSRELLYTAVTRSKVEVRVGASKEVLLLTLNRKVSRFGGLTARIHEALVSLPGGKYKSHSVE